MNKISYIVFVWVWMLINLASCGSDGQIEVRYEPPIAVPISVSINSLGEIKLGFSGAIVTPVGTFLINADTNIYSVRDQYADKVLIVRVDGNVIVYALEQGKEFRVSFDESNKLYRKVSLVYESDGDIILELETAQHVEAELNNPPLTQSNNSPEFDHIDQHEEYLNGQLIISSEIYFSDADGDAQLIEYDLQSIVPYISGIHVESDNISNSSSQQRAGTYKTVSWECGAGRKTYTVTLRARIVDREGNQSSDFNVVFSCHT